MLSSNDREWFGRRGELTHDEAQIMEQAFDDIAFRSRQLSVPVAHDDRLAAFEASFVRYLIESRPVALKVA